MTTTLLISLAIALALYLVLPKMWRNQSPKAKRQEKAEIMKQLLDLSDRENLLLANASHPAAPSTFPCMQPGKPRKKPAAIRQPR
jgi:hypothetical protein